jgi:putative tryptophan/tyrosine transport system substrate-binding protein
MKRRQFITVLGGAAIAWPLAARAQQPAPALVGFLNIQSLAGRTYQVEAFRTGLSELGYLEGRNITIEYRWAENQYERLPALAMDLVRRGVTVIAATGGAASARAAKTATSTIPIVFAVGSDPVDAGLVASLNRPGGNVTGVSFLTDALAAKRVSLLREVMAQPGIIAVLMNPQGPDAERQSKELPSAAQAIGQSIEIVNASTETEIETAFAAISRSRAAALVVAADPFFNDQRERIVALATQLGLPAIYESRSFVAAGGLMSYGASIADAYRQAGVYVGQILKGEKPAELPVLQATKFEFVINLKTAKALSIELHPQLLAIADEVIE